ncbi:hypothetical protein [Streptomyces hydrogenans]|uniref:hypothetical protein n=1 Tax=Streptomyces hydrogenans TaxID=1873719 RepID=UPI0035D99F67
MAAGGAGARPTSTATGGPWPPPWAREQNPGPTEEERELLAELSLEHRVPGASDVEPLPMIGLAQLYRRDVPDLPVGPDGCDLLQVFWCPFHAHGPGRHDLELYLRRRRSGEVGRVLGDPPQPLVVGSEGLCARIDTWEEALEEAAERPTEENAAQPVRYQYDLSIPPGWRVDGYASGFHLVRPDRPSGGVS